MNTAEIVGNILDQVKETEIKNPSIPSLLLAYGGAENDGISAQRVSGNIIARQSEFGADNNSTLPSGNDNMMNKLILVIVEEIFKELKLHARVEVANQIGSMKITATGANAGGPVVVTGQNIAPGKSYGIIR